MTIDEKFDAKLVLGSNGRRINWNKSYSPYDYRLSEVISAVGKEIRRGNDELSAFWAYQMMISGSEAEDFLWERFKVIAIEDVGMAAPQAAGVINSVETTYRQLPSKSVDRFATGVFAAVYLARCPKTRYTIDLMLDIRNRLQEGSLRPKIPDYALDVHLPHARKNLGRDAYHYLIEGAKLENEDQRFPKEYHARLLERAKKERTKKQKK